jgi:hypothetical protein
MSCFARNQFGQINQQNGGFIFQNFIYQLLIQKYSSATDRICFWRTTDKAEVDFVVRQSKNIIPIEVKFSYLKKTTLSRSFRSFIEKYQPETAMVVNLHLDEKIQVANTIVRFLPYWKII